MISFKLLLAIGGILCGLSVVLGAFAAHGLKGSLNEPLLQTFQTGVHYQFFHGLAIILVVILSKQLPHSLWQWSGNLFVLGVVLFSGSLYMLSLTGVKWFGPITPIGGVAFILGWGVFVMASIKSSVSL